MTRLRALGLGLASLIAIGLAVPVEAQGAKGGLTEVNGPGVRQAEASAAAASVGVGERWESLRVYANDPTVFVLRYRVAPRLPYTAELDAKGVATQIVSYLTKAGHDVSVEHLSIIVFAQQTGGRLSGGKPSTVHLGAAIFNPRNGLVYWEPGW